MNTHKCFDDAWFKRFQKSAPKLFAAIYYDLGPLCPEAMTPEEYKREEAKRIARQTSRFSRLKRWLAINNPLRSLKNYLSS
jgi:hypothetical protein